MPTPYAGGQFPGSKIFAVDSDHTIAAACSVPRISFPFEGDSHASANPIVVLNNAANASTFKYGLQTPSSAFSNQYLNAFILEQDFMMAADFYGAISLNTPYDPAYAPFYDGNLALGIAYLIAEGPTTDAGGGLVRWTRTYATIPPPRNSYETFTFTFPGTMPNAFGEVGLDTVGTAIPPKVLTGSPPITVDVLARVEHIYFMLDNSGLTAFSPDFLDPSSPFYVVPKFKVFFQTKNNEVEYAYNGDFKSLVTWLDASGHPIAPASLPMSNTIPPLITGDVSNDADSGVGYVNMIAAGAEVCVRASQIRPWRGNIYEKITLWARAQ